MKVLAPAYCKKFVCKADKCRHSCCVGWEIDVDLKTVEKYKNLNGDYAKEIVNSLSNDDLPCFKLMQNDRCPHLDEKGLCKIITAYGKDLLCDICREHPRFYNITKNGKEMGIGISCEEGCKIVLESEDYAVFEEVGNEDGEEIQNIEIDSDFYREKVYSILLDSTLSYADKLLKISEEFSVNLSIFSDDEWIDILNSLEYLNEEHKQLFSNFSTKLFTPLKYQKYLERILAYFVYRHCSQALDYGQFCAELGFCLFCERLVASLLKMRTLDGLEEIVEIARIVSEEIEYSEDNMQSIKFEFLY